MSESFESDTVNVEGLDQLLKALKQKAPVARIGVLADKSSRTSDQKKGGPSNAEIGAAHEYGAPARGLPQRSFLRVPISDELQKRMAKDGALTENEFKQVIKQGSVVPWLKKISVLAEGIVKEAFATRGFGKWSPWKGNYESKTGDVLVDTTQLRDSITSEVKE